MGSVSVQYSGGRHPVWEVSLLLIAFLAGPVLEGGQPALARVWYVSGGALGTDNGDSWGDAFRDLQDALAVAQFGDEIWVAAGRYTPDRGSGDWAASFVLVDGVGLYGGFAGWEATREQRDWMTNETILSGDLNGDDGPIDCSPFSNCCAWRPGEFGCDDPDCEATVCATNPYCCLGPNGWDTSCTTVARSECCDLGGWNACENSGNVLNASNLGPWTAIDGITISGSHHRDDPPLGAGVLLNGAAITIRNCTLAGNDWTGARANAAASPVFENCLIVDNIGSGVYIYNAGRPAFRNCSFLRNVIGISGADLTATNCDFISNRGEGLNVGGDVSVYECRFTDNRLRAINHSGGFLSLSDSVFIANKGGAIFNSSSRSLVRNCVFLGQRHQVLSSSAVDNAFVDCLFSGNETGVGTLYQSDGRLSLVNCTLAHNRTSGSWAAIDVSYTRVAITNSILWGNRNPDSRNLEAMQIRYYNSGGNPEPAPDINHSNVEGWTGALGGVGNGGTDPLFVDPDGADDVIGTEDDNLRLSPDSPAINAGDPDAALYLSGADLDGHERFLCGRVDIGAYEFGIGDIDCNQTVDLADYAAWPFCVAHPDAGANGFGCNSFDFNADGAIDLRDFAGFQRAFGP